MGVPSASSESGAWQLAEVSLGTTAFPGVANVVVGWAGAPVGGRRCGGRRRGGRRRRRSGGARWWRTGRWWRRLGRRHGSTLGHVELLAGHDQRVLVEPVRRQQVGHPDVELAGDPRKRVALDDRVPLAGRRNRRGRDRRPASEAPSGPGSAAQSGPGSAVEGSSVAATSSVPSLGTNTVVVGTADVDVVLLAVPIGTSGGLS